MLQQNGNKFYIRLEKKKTRLAKKSLKYWLSTHGIFGMTSSVKVTHLYNACEFHQLLNLFDGINRVADSISGSATQQLGPGAPNFLWLPRVCVCVCVCARACA